MAKWKSIAVIILVVIIGAGLISFSNIQRASAKDHIRLAALKDNDSPAFATSVSYEKLKKENAGVKAAVKPYEVAPGLTNVANYSLFKSLLGPEQMSKIEKNGFVVTSTNYTQMSDVYENNEYQLPKKFPAFITTDSILHTYHVFYDYTLRQVESNKLYDAALKLTDAMLAISNKDYLNARDSFVKDAARRNLAYFAVARNLLKGTPPPSVVADMANVDLKQIKDHAGRDKSAILGYEMDFSQFVPRGHYTRTEKLKKYFRGMMWYGLAPFPTPQGKIGPRPTVQALLVVRNLRLAKSGKIPAIKLWQTIYDPTVFYVGSADDYTVYQYAKLSDKVFGNSPSINDFGEKKKLNGFITEVEKLPGPGIENFVAGGGKMGENPLFPTGRQFRFMGQRFIPDSRILQEMTHPKVDGRNFPKGLDVFAAMGSDRALQILEDVYDCSAFVGFQAQMEKMREEMRNTPLSKWQSNLYYGWLWSLQPLPEPAGDGYPSFMRNNAWIDKSLFSALGSWTELRHDTILYAKQSVTECGGAEEEVAVPKGYVEPNLEFWTRLLWLNNYSKAGLKSRGLLDTELTDKFNKLDDWLVFCRNITIKELTNRKVTDEEYQQMEFYGAELERLTLDFAGGDLLSEADKDMALAADVHTSFDMVMEEATGRAGAIYVVVPIEGKLYITRGSVYTQYEFEWPASDRLTDEKWQQMLKTNTEPGLADWTKSFFTDTKNKPAPEFENYVGGC